MFGIIVLGIKKSVSILNLIFLKNLITNFKFEYLAVQNYKGTIKCPSDNNLCSNAPSILDWPIFSSINPTSGNPGDTVTIYGRNFVDGMTVSIGGQIAESVSFVDSQTYYAKVSSILQATTLGTNSVYVILTDPKTGRTAVGSQVFTLTVNVISSVGNWIEENPVWFALIIVGAVLLIVVGTVIACRERMKARYGTPTDRYSFYHR